MGARAKGVRLGAPVGNDGDLAERAIRLRKRGNTLQAIADTFNAEGLRTVKGRLFAPTVTVCPKSWRTC